MNDPSSVIKAVMKYKHVTGTEIAEMFGVSPQAITNKFRRNTWDLNEVIKILDYMNCRLVIEPDDVVTFRF